MKHGYLLEFSWEVCNQSGGIYTVISSKLNQAMEAWGTRYCLVGPYLEKQARSEWEEDLHASNIFAKAARSLRDKGLDIRYGFWLTRGRPHTILVNLDSVRSWICNHKLEIADSLLLPDWRGDALVTDTLAYGYLSDALVAELMSMKKKSDKIIAHYHEWMAATYLPLTKARNPELGTIFTTHATLLGRYIASNDENFYDHVEEKDWAQEAARYWIETQATLERHAALAADVFTSVSEVTARECKQFLGREPDILLPNGINIQRFTALHEFQNLHQVYKKKIHEFIRGYFFPSYSFDLDKTLLFFTSGRFEFHELLVFNAK